MKGAILFFNLLLLASAGVAADFSFEGEVREVFSWKGSSLMRVSLHIASGDSMMEGLQIIIDSRDGSVKKLTWMSKNAPNQTKFPPVMIDLLSSEKGRRFAISFTGEEFSRAKQDTLLLSRFRWLPLPK